MNRSEGNSPPFHPEWADYSDEQLLDMRICDLKLRIEGTRVEPMIRSFYGELEERKIAFKPRCYLGDEWFCLEGATTIAIPFYLAHPRLMKLEEKMMLEVEGGTESWFMRLMRHEMGHVMNHAYRLEKRRDWQVLFGPTSLEYSESYRARPYSKRFVRHLEDWYAQSHPEEDFAETFAIWLTPGIDWRRQYRGWKALEKLEYVDRTMAALTGRPPEVVSQARISEASRLRSRLKVYYGRRRRLYAHDFPDFFDSDLRRLFADPSSSEKGESAAVFLRRIHKTLLGAVSLWTGEPKFTINRIMRSLVERCAELDLRLRKEADLSGLEVAAYLASLALHYRLTGKFKKR